MNNVITTTNLTNGITAHSSALNVSNMINNSEETKMNNIEALKAQAKATIEAKLKAAREKAELELLMNDKFQDAMVNQQIREEATARLSSLNAQCEAIVSGMEVYSKTLRKVRTWNPSKRYGYGNQFAELSGLLNGIQYSVQEHSDQMLAVTGLSKDLIERTLNALGQLPYYNTNHNVLVDGIPTNAVELYQCVQLIEQKLGVMLDKSYITQANADRQFNNALIRAEGAQAEAQTMLNMEFAIVR